MDKKKEKEEGVQAWGGEQRERWRLWEKRERWFVEWWWWVVCLWIEGLL